MENCGSPNMTDAVINAGSPERDPDYLLRDDQQPSLLNGQKQISTNPIMTNPTVVARVRLRSSIVAYRGHSGCIVSVGVLRLYLQNTHPTVRDLWPKSAVCVVLRVLALAWCLR